MTGAARTSGRAWKAFASGLAMLGLAACGDGASASSAASPAEAPAGKDGTVIGLSTSLPIFWSESDDPADMLAPQQSAHWALGVMRERGDVRPLDTLDSRNGSLDLAPEDLLVLAQPYPFSPGEYVALDAWVRAGGHVLLFADPMLTAESRFALGDRRRPQDMAILSPILARWGLRLTFDAESPVGLRSVPVRGMSYPVSLPGRFEPAGDGGQGTCALEAEGLIAQCTVGRGQVLAVSDAALLEDGSAEAGKTRAALLRRLIDDTQN